MQNLCENFSFLWSYTIGCCKTQSKLIFFCLFILIYSISIVEEDTETLDKPPEGGVFSRGGGGVGGFCMSCK